MASGKRTVGPSGPSVDSVLVFAALALFVLLLCGTWSSLQLAAMVNGTGQAGHAPAAARPPLLRRRSDSRRSRTGAPVGGTDPVAADPVGAVIGLIDGSVQWSTAATWAAVLQVLVLGALVRLGFVGVRHLRNAGSRVDRTARLMSERKDLHRLTREGAQRIAERLGTAHAGPGIPIGRTVRDDLALFGSWEDLHIDIWGTRTGKTTSRAVPAILDAPGAVIATSNKRDLVDATRDPRAKDGQVWVFDPQDVCAEEPTWWWNPLSYVTDEVKARQLADHFVASQRSENARTDAYFDAAGTDLLAGLLLAAAVAKRPITQVYSWLADQRNDEPERILRTIPGLRLSADALAGVISAPDKQRAGVYGTAQQSAQFLVNRKVTRWVAPDGPNDERPQFNPYEFVRGGGTLYSLSKEGAGTAGPLVTALTVAVIEAAEDYAKTCPGGRLPSPLVGVLDEAANVCRWKGLPDLYSHFGSRGIVLLTILQSWAQGVECWGERGMEKLWSAANIRVYGGGVPDATFLERLSKLIGDYDILSSSVSYNNGVRGTSKQSQRHHIMEVSDLASLPPGRAVVFPSGVPATMIKTCRGWSAPTPRR